MFSRQARRLLDVLSEWSDPPAESRDARGTCGYAEYYAAESFTATRFELADFQHTVIFLSQVGQPLDPVFLDTLNDCRQRYDKALATLQEVRLAIRVIEGELKEQGQKENDVVAWQSLEEEELIREIMLGEGFGWEQKDEDDSALEDESMYTSDENEVLHTSDDEEKSDLE